MPFLKFEAGVEYDLTITKEEIERRVGHWINGKRFDCGGDVCQYCTAKFDKKIENLIEVNHAGEDKTLTLPGVAFQMLEAFGYPLLGKRFTVCRQGTGTSTKYVITSPDHNPLPAPDVTPPGEVKPAVNLASVAVTLRQMADDIDEWLGHARFP